MRIASTVNTSAAIARKATIPRMTGFALRNMRREPWLTAAGSAGTACRLVLTAAKDVSLGRALPRDASANGCHSEGVKRPSSRCHSERRAEGPAIDELLSFRAERP